MGNIEKRYMIDSNNLNGETYFTSIVQEAYAKGLLDNEHIEDIQVQCIKLLADKSESYNCGKSSSIRVEAAEEIMKSNLYTIGLYLKSLPDGDSAVRELKRTAISEMYEKGRKIINIKFRAANHIYRLAQKNKLTTINYTYNATLSYDGIGIFFDSYNPDYEAHLGHASIDYQLCSPVNDLAGVEFIQKYLENLYLENEFCRKFAPEDIHHLLCGYDKGYKDLLINIFEHVLTAALGCSLANRSVVKLNLSEEEIQRLYNEISKENEYSASLKIRNAAHKILEELNITNPSVKKYIDKSLLEITLNIIQAARKDPPDKTFVSPINLDLKPKIQFLSGTGMDDREYREFIDELLTCRYSSDKFAFIKEKVKSFNDMEDVLLDGQLSEEEIDSVLGIFGDAELAALIRRHSFKTDIQAVDLSETELTLRLYLKTILISFSKPDRNRFLKWWVS